MKLSAMSVKQALKIALIICVASVLLVWVGLAVFMDTKLVDIHMHDTYVVVAEPYLTGFLASVLLCCIFGVLTIVKRYRHRVFLIFFLLTGLIPILCIGAVFDLVFHLF
ncbi:hypothetical protein [Chitinophaga solisilvae]|uniref:hypothetical protein n=1 Tax=Chitinophaga solisilvae TaxID=1233460 RepID=UPI00136BD1CD|nr:hypothetical protein [Chitinophaga solisilvae]